MRILNIVHYVLFYPEISDVNCDFFGQLFPLLVQSLLCDNIQLQQSTMETLCTMITDAPDVILKHIDTVIPQLLKLTAYKPVMVG